MLRQKVVLVLGAGSSVEFGLPTGADLAKVLIEDLAIGREEVGGVAEGRIRLAGELVRYHNGEFTQYAAAANVISRALPHYKSIDDCLFTYSDDPRAVMVGKLAIANAISEREQKSFLWRSLNERSGDPIVSTTYGNTWAYTFCQALVTGIKKTNLTTMFNNLTVINFNYDRCFEAALLAGLSEALQLPGSAIEEAMDALCIYRPYGSLGPYPLNGMNGVPLGGLRTSLTAMAKNLKIYTEEAGDRPDLANLQDHIDDCDTIVFLGFGFHQQNMDLLHIGKPKQNSRWCFTSAYQEHSGRRETFERRIQSAIGRAILRMGGAEESCNKFLRPWMDVISG